MDFWVLPQAESQVFSACRSRLRLAWHLPAMAMAATKDLENNTQLRTIVKGLTWRVSATLVTILIGFLITVRWAAC